MHIHKRFNLDPDKKETKGININPEHPYLSFTELWIESESLQENDLDSLVKNIEFVYQFDFLRDDGSLINVDSRHFNFHKNISHTDLLRNFPSGYHLQLDKPELVNGTNDYVKVNIYIKNLNSKPVNIALKFITQDLFVDLNSSKNDFYTHIKDPGNIKILFSAPFGQGKTTFLKWFFEQNEQEFETFHLHPVHYSVASNEDIFRFIKTELLFKLLGRDVEFEKENFSVDETVGFLLSHNPEKILSSFVKDLPKVGESAVTIASKLLETVSSLKEHHDEVQVDEQKDAKEFLRKIYDEEGSIYDDNFYTQLIRQLIGQLNQKGKKTVLVLDDLDRMDPEHIFRILNVFAAHFDSFSDDNSSNKFDFSKIVLVGDIGNLEKIYHHKFGKETDFEGYISKFYSEEVFYFHNKLGLSEFIESYFSNSGKKDNWVLILNILLLDFVAERMISLRSVLRILDTFKNHGRSLPVGNTDFSDSIVSHIALLSKELTTEKLETIFKEMSRSNIFNDNNYKILSTYCLIPLTEGGKKTFKYNGRELIVKNVKPGSDRFLKADLDDNSDFEFKKQDFYSLMFELLQINKGYL
jgi:hypothetical protein